MWIVKTKNSYQPHGINDNPHWIKVGNIVESISIWKWKYSEVKSTNLWINVSINGVL